MLNKYVSTAWWKKRAGKTAFTHTHMLHFRQEPAAGHRTGFSLHFETRSNLARHAEV